MRHGPSALAVIGVGLTLAGAAGAGYADQESSATLLPRFSNSSDYGFGSSVALSRNGRVMAVGNPEHDKRRGSVSIYTRAFGGDWRRRARLSPTQQGDGLGTSVALSADGRVVLAGVNRAKGAAWIYRSAGGGIWVGQKLAPKDSKGGAFFGYSVALSESGSTALVGGPGDNGFRGAAWVFTRQGANWKQQGSKLAGGSESGAGRFGWSVALSGDGSRALIGGPRDRASYGAVWLFSRSGSSWRQTGNKLTAPSVLGVRPFRFGWDVALSASGRLALVGAPGMRLSDIRTGAAFVYTRTDSGWVRRKRLEASRSIYQFGESLSLSPSGTAAAVGGYWTGRSGVEFTHAEAFSCTALGCAGPGQVLSPKQSPTDDVKISKGYGTDVAVADDADAVVVGAPGEPAKTRTERTFGQVWTFLSWPAVKSLRPVVGPETGGTDVAVTGENFLKVKRVLFGSTPATSFSVQSPTLLTAVSPPGQGSVEVMVVTAVGTSPPVGGWFVSADSSFFYVPRPVVTGLAPTLGPTAGGTPVTITGTGLATGATVRFGERVATVTGNQTSTQLTVLSPTTGSAGTVDVTVTTAGGTSETSAATKFTYLAPVVEAAISFDNLVTGGIGGGGPLVQVTNQYVGQGVTFNSPRAIDYSKGSAIPGFARSGTIAIEQCVGVEFCTTPIRGTFATPKSMVRVWVGFSFQLNAPLQVQLRALNGSGSVLGTASATLPARSTPTPISVPLEVRPGGTAITQFEVLVPGGFNNAVAVDDVTFEG